MSKTLIITGASRGIGFAMVQHATQAGHRVYALSRTIQSLKKSDLLYPYAIDLTDENAIADFANELKQLDQNHLDSKDKQIRYGCLYLKRSNNWKFHRI